MALRLLKNVKVTNLEVVKGDKGMLGKMQGICYAPCLCTLLTSVVAAIVPSCLCVCVPVCWTSLHPFDSI